MLIKELYSIPELKAAIRKAREIRANIRFGMSEMTDVRISKIEALDFVSRYYPDTTPREMEMPCGYFGTLSDGVLHIG